MRPKTYATVEVSLPRLAAEPQIRIGRRIHLLDTPPHQHIIATAPPGFGKTTLLRELSDQAKASGAKVA